jgi:hypothetical protein
MRTRVVIEEVQVEEQAQASMKAPSARQEEKPTEAAEEVAPVVATAGA